MSPAIKRQVLGLALTFAAGCAPPAPDPSPSPSRAGITGGEVDNGDPAVVAVQLSAGGSCSGTLISPRMVLTAAHCEVQPPRLGTVSFGTTVAAPTRQVAIADTAVWPGSDLRLLKLATPVLDVAPIPINTEPLGPAEVGRAIRHVGFGLDAYPRGGVADTKRQATLVVRQVLSEDLIYSSADGGSGVCFGDSGGPGLMWVGAGASEVVVGVASSLVSEPACYAGADDVRVDAFSRWIAEVSAVWELQSCRAGDGCTPNCSPVDPDCVCGHDGVCDLRCPRLSDDPDCPADCGRDGVCSSGGCPLADPDCTALGAACTADAQCQYRACATQGGSRFCSRGCATTDECPPSMYCSGTNRVCLQRPRLGEGCDATLPCGEGVCVSEPTGGKLCRAACTSSASCAPDQQCVASSDGPGICRPRPPAPPAVPPKRGCTAAPGTLSLALLCACWVGLRRRP